MHTEISPWVDKVREHRVVVAGAIALLVLLVALIWVAWRWGVAEDRMEMLEARAEAGFLQAPSSTRNLRVDLRAPRILSIDGGGFPQRIDLLVNARTKQYARFRVSLVHADGTLLFHADQMVRDSNDNLRLSFNTSILPDGKYEIRVEGYARGGKMERFGEVPMQVSGR
jgi:hypothetical protein